MFLYNLIANLLLLVLRSEVTHRFSELIKTKQSYVSLQSKLQVADIPFFNS